MGVRERERKGKENRERTKMDDEGRKESTELK